MTEHTNVISTLIIIVMLVILYKLHDIELKTVDSAVGYYFILLEIMALAFDNIYDAYGDVCV